MRHFILWSLCTVLAIGALAQSITPPMHATALVLPDVQVSANTLAGDATLTTMEADGRRVALQELSLAVGLTDPLAAGATYRRVRSHGRSVTNRYDARGWEFWGAWRLRPTGWRLTDPGLLLLGSFLHEAGGLQVITSSSVSFASPSTDILGGQAVLLWQPGAGSGHLRGGAARVSVNHDDLATVLLAGGGWEQTFGARVSASATTTLFHDDYQGRHTDIELAGSLRVAASAHGGLTLGAYYYPRGIPMAGAAFSPAASVGAVYGSAATDPLRNDAVGLLTLTLDMRY